MDDRLLLTRKEAAGRLGFNLKTLERHVQPHIRLVRVGRLRMVPVAELERWVAEHQDR